MNSNRGKEWQAFSDIVLNHIENYTVPQYGDFPQDPASDFTIEQLTGNIKKYIARFGKNQRAGQDQLDLLKIAHYACIAYSKILNGEDK